MKPLKQLAKLKNELGLAATDNDVQAISQIMDELSAAAAGGMNPDQMTLADYFEPEPQTQTNHRCTK
ncbi:hypothetical protein [Pseudomonas sp. H26/SER47-MNA-CIBAN-0231]|uniref:hypothetical protein n=1 Tax=Pseudomonas sp. H26/SER47-MNA-CIBAN-0231 TaxID=3140477 RepID=UPI0033257FDD